MDYFHEGINGDVVMQHVNMSHHSSYLIKLLMSKVWRDVNTLRARLTLMYFRLGRLQRVYTYVQHV